MITAWNILSCVKQKMDISGKNEEEILSVCEHSQYHARQLVSTRTFGRSSNEELYKAFQGEIDGAIIEIAVLIACQAILHNSNSGDSQTLKSESVGGYSVTYETDSDKLLMSDEDIEKRELQIINKWLEPTDLMYRGASM